MGPVRFQILLRLATLNCSDFEHIFALSLILNFIVVLCSSFMCFMKKLFCDRLVSLQGMWDLTPNTELLMELPEEYTFETALADLIVCYRLQLKE